MEGNDLMCGICGWIDFEKRPISNEIACLMIDVLHHRGPDGNASYVSSTNAASAFLGHTRLKIIDLSDAAKQPIPNETEKIWVVFNGEIYNFREIRAQLKVKGHRFRSHSDTEVIVHAYEEFGEDFIPLLDGMFAFALWDEQKNVLILARDRTGKKPLYYHFNGRRLTFASEIKALVVCPWIERRTSIKHLPDYFIYGYVQTPATLYEDIFQVPPASYLKLDENGLHSPHHYWKLNFQEKEPSLKIGINEAAKKVRELLIAAVSKRMISDVPLGVLLSGGLDSSIIVGIMSQILKVPVQTFSIGFTDHTSFDERHYASLVARHFNTDHIEFAVEMDVLKLLDRLLWHHDQPYGDSSSIPTYLVAELTKQHVTVALNGDGGDEVFAGYERFLAALISWRIPRNLRAAGRFVSRFIPRKHGYYSLRRRMERFFGDSGDSLQETYLGLISIFNDEALREIFCSDVLGKVGDIDPQESVHQCFQASNKLSPLHQLLYFNFMNYLPCDLHVKMDRMSMAHSLETRSPMLDTSLIEFVSILPAGMKIRKLQMKYILKKAFHDLIPPVILNRKKHGFGVPLGIWFRDKLGIMFEEFALSDSARLKSYLNQPMVRRMLKDHQSGIQDYSYRLWSLLQFELWLRMMEKDSSIIIKNNTFRAKQSI